MKKHKCYFGKSRKHKKLPRCLRPRRPQYIGYLVLLNEDGKPVSEAEAAEFKANIGRIK